MTFKWEPHWKFNCAFVFSGGDISERYLSQKEVVKCIKDVATRPGCPEETKDLLLAMAQAFQGCTGLIKLRDALEQKP